MLRKTTITIAKSVKCRTLTKTSTIIKCSISILIHANTTYLIPFCKLFFDSIGRSVSFGLDKLSIIQLLFVEPFQFNYLYILLYENYSWSVTSFLGKSWVMCFKLSCHCQMYKIKYFFVEQKKNLTPDPFTEIAWTLNWKCKQIRNTFSFTITIHGFHGHCVTW